MCGRIAFRITSPRTQLLSRKAGTALDLQPPSANRLRRLRPAGGAAEKCWEGRESSLCSGISHATPCAGHPLSKVSFGSSVQSVVPHCFKIIGELLDACHHKLTELATVCLRDREQGKLVEGHADEHMLKTSVRG